MKNHFLRIGLTVISAIIVLSVGFLPGEGLIPASAATDPIWTFVGCNGSNCINYDSNKGAQYPAITTFKNELYAIWDEDSKIRVKLYREGSGWIQAGTPNPLNRDGTHTAENVCLMVYNEKLYAAWDEYTEVIGGTAQIHVSEYNGISWTAADGPNGCLNFGVTANAYRPSLAVYNGNLYAAWSEVTNHGNNLIRVSKYDGSGWNLIDQNGSNGSINGSNGINYNSDYIADYPVLAAYNNRLYAAWQEYNDSGKWQVIVKSYDGNSTGTWNLVDDGVGDVGLNCNSSNNAQNPTIIEYNGALYCAWEEKTLTYAQIHVKKYNGSTWAYVKDSGDAGWNYNSGRPAASPTFCVFNRSLYVSWGETATVSTPTGSVNKKQIRIAKYNSDTDTISFFDGNNTTGLNKDNAQSAEYPALAVFNGDLCVAWQEYNATTGFDQILVKKSPIPAAIISTNIADGTYGPGKPLDINITFNKPVSVTGTPYIPITLKIGLGTAATVNATYVNGSGPTDLVFRYTVNSGDQDSDGIELGSNPAITLGTGGIIKDQAAGLDADLNLNALPATTGVLVDGVKPTVSITSTAGSPTEVSPIPVTITFSEAVTDFGLNDIAVTNGNMSNFNGSGTTYTGDISPSSPGIVTVNVAAGVAHDAAGNGNTAASQFSCNYNGTAKLTISADMPVLAESNLDGRKIILTLVGTTFKDSTLLASNFTLYNIPTGLTITGISRSNNSQCEITLTFNGSMTTNINDFHITIDSSVINSGGSGLISNDLTIIDDLYSNKHYTNPSGSGGGNGSYLRNFLTAGNFRGDLMTTWNHDELILGKGVSGINSDLWFYYPGLTGPGGLIPTNTPIDRAELVLKVKSINGDKYTLRRIKIYTIPDAGLERPYFGTVDGLRSGLNFLYRDNRLGRKVLWKKETANILAAVTATELNDTFEYLPYAFEENGEMFIKVDITKALKAWAADPAKNQGWYILSEGEGKAGDSISIYGTTTANVSDRPYLRVIYADNGTDLTPPGPVTINTPTLSNLQVTLNWQNPSADFQGVRIVRKYGSTAAGPDDGKIIYDGNGTSWVDNSGLENGKTYYYAFFAYDAERNYSTKAYANYIPGSWTLPASPTALTGSPSTTSVDLRWADNSNNETEFIIERKTGAVGWTVIASVPKNRTAYHDGKLQPGTTYDYRVTAKNPAGLSLTLPTTSVRTLDAPTAPANLSWSVISSSEVQLRWDEVTGQAYRVEILDETGALLWSEPATIDLKAADPAVFQYSVMQLTANIGYRFRVVAINGYGENAAEIEVIKTAADPKPIFF